MSLRLHALCRMRSGWPMPTAQSEVAPGLMSVPLRERANDDTLSLAFVNEKPLCIVTRIVCAGFDAPCAALRSVHTPHVVTIGFSVALALLFR